MKNLSRIVIPIEFQAEATAPASPHFKDEVTLLTARAVVPIATAVHLRKVRNYLVKAAIIAAAALLGTAAALSVYSFQNRRHTTAGIAEPSAPATQATGSETSDTAQTSAPQSRPAQVSADTTKAKSADAQIDLSETPTADMEAETKEKKPATNENQIQEKSARASGAADGRNVVVKRSEPVAQRQRAAKVQRSNDPAQNVERPRDAGRIHEIFEGPSPF